MPLIWFSLSLGMLPLETRESMLQRSPGHLESPRANILANRLSINGGHKNAWSFGVSRLPFKSSGWVPSVKKETCYPHCVPVKSSIHRTQEHNRCLLWSPNFGLIRYATKLTETEEGTLWYQNKQIQQKRAGMVLGPHSAEAGKTLREWWGECQGLRDCEWKSDDSSGICQDGLKETRRKYWKLKEKDLLHMGRKICNYVACGNV